MCANKHPRQEKQPRQGGRARVEKTVRPIRNEQPDFTKLPFGRCGPLDPELVEVTTISRWRLSWTGAETRTPGRRSEDLDDLE